MNDYRPDTPRAAFAFGAVGLTALTLGAFVVAPALFDSGFAPDTTLAAAQSRAPIEVCDHAGAHRSHRRAPAAERRLGAAPIGALQAAGLNPMP